MKSFTSGLFILLFAEMAMGGGGRLMSFGPVSLRMFLFVAALLYTIILIVSGEKISREYKFLLAFFLLTIIIGWIRGLYRGAQQQYWWEDIKPLLYFLILPFLAIVSKNEINIRNASRIIRCSAVLLATGFFTILFLLHSRMVPFLNFYTPALSTGEFFFRGELTFFFKGFLYLCIGLIFIHFLNQKYKAALVTLVLLAILFTFTRGFILALCLSYTVYYFLNRQYAKASVFSTIAILTITFGQTAIGSISQAIDSVKNQNKTFNTTTTNKISPENQQDTSQKNLLGDRNFSDGERLQQIKEVVDRISPVSFLIGHGFGNGVPSRKVHMEISYLEIFHKQGLLGLAFWSYIMIMLFQKYRTAPASPTKDAFFCGALFVFFQSLTNQYINNPIGLSMVILTLTCLDRLNDKHTLNNEIYE